MSRHIRQSPVDGQWRRWELLPSAFLGIQSADEANQVRSDGSSCAEYVQCCTGVFKTRSQAKRDTYGNRS